jgi:D-beta-D-heptose 7-phosphate kinase / D-beta-D-heptose 1-phosphate adenosyltransferase
MAAEAILKALAKARVAVIGDVMLDHYVTGAVRRISPEAPVPILLAGSERYALGGAANVAANVAALGGGVVVLALIGDDAAGHHLSSMLSGQEGVSAHLLATTHPTVVKTRYVGDRQQILRVDRESLEPYPPAAIEALMAALDDVIAKTDVVVLSDYGKGTLTDPVLAAVFAVAARTKKPVIVDPKRKALADYRGASFITPNRKELEAAVDLPTSTDAQAQAAAAAAIAQSGAAILLTRSEKGMSLFREGAAPLHLSTQAREVFDVSGAGDTVVAALAAGLAGGLSVERAMQVANSAAGVVVAKLGTAVCTTNELRQALTRASARAPVETAPPQSAPATWDQTAEIRRTWRDEGLTVGFANGCFDLLHPGHVTLLRKAAAQVDRLIVAINADASVAALKGPSRPVQTQDARAAVLLGLKGVDLVVVFEQDTPLELITRLVPDVLFKGADYREEDVVGGDVIKAAGGRVVLIDLVEGHSTSALVKRANEQP